MNVPTETARADQDRSESWRALLIQRAGWIMLLLGTPLAVYLSTFIVSGPWPVKLASLWLFPLAGAFAALARGGTSAFEGRCSCPPYCSSVAWSCASSGSRPA